MLVAFEGALAPAMIRLANWLVGRALRGSRGEVHTKGRFAFPRLSLIVNTALRSSSKPRHHNGKDRMNLATHWKWLSRADL
jgi:hypothetical protein